MGILIAFWVIFTVSYLAATELLSMAKSKGEVLIFRRSHFVKTKHTRRMAEADDEETLGTEIATMAQLSSIDETRAFLQEGEFFQWEDVCYDIKTKGEVRRILDHVDGFVQAKTLTALMVRISISPPNQAFVISLIEENY